MGWRILIANQSRRVLLRRMYARKTLKSFHAAIVGSAESGFCRNKVGYGAATLKYGCVVENANTFDKLIRESLLKYTKTALPINYEIENLYAKRPRSTVFILESSGSERQWLFSRSTLNLSLKACKNFFSITYNAEIGLPEFI